MSFDRGLRMVLFVLNGLLGWCALLQVLSPHFEFMFLLSLGLTGSYYWYVLFQEVDCWNDGTNGRIGED